MKATPFSVWLRTLLLAWVLVVIGNEAAASGPRFESGSKVDLATVLHDAHRLASAKGDLVVRVRGASMLPYFGDGAVLVVRGAVIESLKPGMIVVYRNRFGEVVAHRIEERRGAGWSVRGANNPSADSTLVTAENLLGAVYVTLYAEPREAGVGERGAGALAERTLVALAASAR